MGAWKPFLLSVRFAIMVPHILPAYCTMSRPRAVSAGRQASWPSCRRLAADGLDAIHDTLERTLPKTIAAVSYIRVAFGQTLRRSVVLAKLFRAGQGFVRRHACARML